ncbi:MAG: Zn-dependent hydrolase [Anaerolineae bacterium]|nr:Zn-dependent hydrolase [Anaerolineae bacterium]
MLQINTQRLLDNLDSLAQIGATADGGVNRSAMSPADVEGRRWFKDCVNDDGFEFREDGAANLSAILKSDVPNAKTLLLGSHLDSVPNGGRFDGPLGVLSALEVLRTIREANIQLPFHVECISFTDEEGSMLALFGSRALTGKLTAESLSQSRVGVDKLREGMTRLGISEESIKSARRDPAFLLGYLEIHIEQGTRLEGSMLDIGAVTAIVGIRDFWLTFSGRAGHAGTTPMDKRADALWGASAFIQGARKMVPAKFDPGVVNVGNLQVAPGAFNIVPGEVRLALEFRHGDEELLDQMQDDLFQLAEQVAEDHDLKLRIEPVGKFAPSLMDEKLLKHIEAAADERGLKHTRLISYAGHDAETIAHVAPSAMIFVPSAGGISHNPREYTKPEDVVNGANVLLGTVLRLAGKS